MIDLIQTLEKTIKIWEWLYNNPDCDDKGEAYKYYGYPILDINDCPCCQYTCDTYNVVDCILCPITWAGDAYMDREDTFCENDESSYLLWLEAEDSECRERGAKGVLNLAKKALEEAKNNKIMQKD